MKKIIATVLAMVMALALCTTAFAAMPEGATKVNPDQGKTLKETYYKLGDEYYTDEECTKLVTAGEGFHLALKQTVKFVFIIEPVVLSVKSLTRKMKTEPCFSPYRQKGERRSAPALSSLIFQ